MKSFFRETVFKKIGYKNLKKLINIVGDRKWGLLLI